MIYLPENETAISELSIFHKPLNQKNLKMHYLVTQVVCKKMLLQQVKNIRMHLSLMRVNNDSNMISVCRSCGRRESG